MARLSRATLGDVPPASRSLVDPGDLTAGIVHLGLGAFHRAHQAVYTEAAMAAAGTAEWGIVGVAPRRRELIDVLAAQDGLFSVTSVDNSAARTRVVGAMAGLHHLPSDPRAVVGRLADPAVRIVTLTVTEKGYRIDPATGLVRVDEALRGELTGRAEPTSVPAVIVAGLRARVSADSGPIAVVSCDNLASNGPRLRRAVTHALEVSGDDVALDWVAANVTFPATMVDRIVPATTPATIDGARSVLGVDDLAAVSAEPYSTWVIEDEFPAGRPAWDAAGAVLTGDAGPFERLKLRALNGVHSALAYLGALAGCPTIDAALRLPGMRPMVERFVAEDVAPSLVPPDGVSVVDYGSTVLERFGNAAISHRCLQVATDGSQKLPQRILHTVIDRRRAGADPRWAALVVAAWMRFVLGRADDGSALPLDDPLAGELRAALAGGGHPVESLHRVSGVFPAELAEDDRWRALVTEWFDSFERHGVKAVLAGATTSPSDGFPDSGCERSANPNGKSGTPQ
jgi:fructuronate reductase